ncbi:hypothetical protein H9Q70_009183 [Fusarium xylarioides]|nr:hypothetical protein H9Q70_009183 [Fusarium xylarioides]
MCTTAMCIAHYLHYHHVPPCYRPTGLNYYYSYCAAAYYDPVTSRPLAPCGSVSTSSPRGDPNDPCCTSWRFHSGRFDRHVANLGASRESRHRRTSAEEEKIMGSRTVE